MRALLAALLLVTLAPRAVWSEPARTPLAQVLPLRDLSGRTWTEDDLAGRVVLIDFWATWCAPCLAELPHQKRAWETYYDDGFRILAISLDQTDLATLKRWLRIQEVPWPQIHDNRGFEGPAALAFEVETLPRSFLFDRAGRLVAADLRGEAFEATVGALVGMGER